MPHRNEPGRRSTATVLLGPWLALTVYASLFPFELRWPPGARPADIFWLPWPDRWLGFDVVVNVAGYAPLGLLVALAALRGGRRARTAFAFAVLAGAGLSWAMEVLQQLLPLRVPSLLDLALNVVGAALGGALAVLALRVGGLAAWSRHRALWIGQGHSDAVALLLVWPVALLPPASLPFGLGQLVQPIRTFASQWSSDLQAAGGWTPLADLLASLAESPPAGPPRSATQMLTALLGVLAPVLLTFASARRGWRRIVMALVLVVIGALATSLSTALNVGPVHALAWLTPEAVWGLTGAAAAALLLSPLHPRLAAGVGLVVLTGLVMLVQQAPPDPYYLQSVQAWDQGEWIRFRGLAHWLAWGWPFAAMLAMLGRVAAPLPRRGGSVD